MGVERSIGMAVEAREKTEGPLTILNEIVHNNSVVRDLDDRGIERTTDINAVNDGTLIISAHGVAPFVIENAQNKGLNVIDSTCPLVTVLHKSADYFIKRGYTVIVFGDPNHDEMQGVHGRHPDKIYVIKEISSSEDLPEIEGKVALISQSTQSLEMFDKAAEVVERKYDDVKIKNTICDATRKRQTAILDLAPQVDLVLVVGSQTSANSKRLAFIAEQIGTPAYLIDNADGIDEQWLNDVDNVGITAGASTPDKLVQEVVNRIKDFANAKGIEEVNIYNGKDEKETADQNS